MCCEDTVYPQSWLCSVKSQTDWICHFTDSGWRKRFREILIAHMCNLAWDASIQYHFGADGVLWPLSLCQYCHWVKSFAKPEQNCTTVMVCHAHNIFCGWLRHLWCLDHCRLKMLHYLLGGNLLHIWNPFENKPNIVLTWVTVTWDLYLCMHLRTYLWLCCLNSAVVFSLLLAVLPLGYLPFFWLLLSSRDKVRWCLPAP